MSKHILMTPDGKRVVISPDDPTLYDAPHNPPNTGTRYTSGTDLRAHRARSGNVYFYLYHWSMWQGTDCRYELITKDQAEKFLLEKAGLAGWDGISYECLESLAEKYGFEVLENA